MTRITLSSGDFANPGSRCLGESTIITFIFNGEDPYIKLFTESGEEKLYVPEIAIRGRMASVMVSGISIKKTSYLLGDSNGDFLDPYASVIDKDRHCGFSYRGDNTSLSFDYRNLIIYKLHLKGATMERYKGKNVGSYKALISHIPYLTGLGINAVELMPIYEFKEASGGKTDYWGYGDQAPYYMAPNTRYFPEDGEKGALELIKALHDAGIAVIMEFCVYGPGNEDSVVGAIRHWAGHYGVDGFRFIGTGIPGETLYQDPRLSGKLLFFEEIPFFVPGAREKRVFFQNDSFVYPIRRLLNHQDGNLRDLSAYIQRSGTREGYVNYLADNTGFTLLDSFSYYDKHNEENGEKNTDGRNFNCSSNCGKEGPAREKNIIEKRLSNIRTSLCTLMFSQGIPLLNAGDECLNSQGGNNNPYCQDNKIGWVNYSKSKDAKNLTEYFKKLCDFRQNHPIITGTLPMDTKSLKGKLPELSYYSSGPWVALVDESTRMLAILFSGKCAKKKSSDIMLLYNFYNGVRSFELPKIPDKSWYFVTNTKAFEFDSEGKLYKEDSIEVSGESLTVLIAK